MVPNEYKMRRALRLLAQEYPNLVEISLFPEFDAPESQPVLFYLAEKGFVQAGQISHRPGQSREMLEAKITAQGLDWLEKRTNSIPAGNETTFGESEALRQFLLQSISTSTLSQETKDLTRTRLLGFSGEDLKALQRRLLQAIAERPELIAKLVISRGVPK